MWKFKFLICCAFIFSSVSAHSWENLSDIPYRIQLRVAGITTESGPPRIIFTEPLSELTGGKRAVAYCFKKKVSMDNNIYSFQATFAKVNNSFYYVNGHARNFPSAVLIVKGIEYNAIDAYAGQFYDKNMSTALQSLIREANLVCN
jgi:hypothetical protein